MKKTREKKKHPYYNFDKLFSYNATFMFAVGGRGIGKTFGAQVKAIRDALDNDNQFIYVRRYKEELKKARNTFFAAIIAAGFFPDYDFRVDGDEAQASGIEFRDDKKREWKTLGYFIPLSTAQSQKSVAFPLVTTIIFDEFIIEKGATHYLPDEAKAFNQLYMTVDRWQDKTRVLFLANAVTVNNPYFIKYKIRPTPDTEWIKAFDGFVAVHIIKSDAFTASVMQTKFGKFIEGTDYADYAVGNQFADNHDHLLAMKDDTARYLYTLQTMEGVFSVWFSGRSRQYYAQEKRPKQERFFVTDERLMREGAALVLRSDRVLQYLRRAFSLGNFSFDSPQTRNALIEIFK